MNLLAAIRNAPARNNIEPAPMADHWRDHSTHLKGYYSPKLNSDGSAYCFDNGRGKTSLAELMELAWKEYEEMRVQEARVAWRQETRRLHMIEENPEVTDISARTINAQPAAWEINLTRKKARATRRRNTKRRQTRRLELITSRVRGTEAVTQRFKKSYGITDLREILQMTPYQLKKGYGCTGAFKIVRMTPLKLERKPWQTAHTSVANFDYTAKRRQTRIMLRFQNTAARSTWL